MRQSQCKGPLARNTERGETEVYFLHTHTHTQ